MTVGQPRQPDEKLLGGKYLLLRELAVGGMAEIFLAQSVGPVGFEKLVVIKRILPEYAENADFQRMFIDEARLASSMSHPNVVLCFDLGESPEGLYLVMEYLAGQDLRSVARASAKLRQHLPLDFVLHVITSAAEGLHYAHQLTGEGGKSLNLVHRDVTPSNVFITWDGIVKVLDFGIAQAEARLSRTQAGMMKGKIQYMAPEQIRSEPLDGRVDQFALGAMLYELLAGRRMFKDDNDLTLINAILAPERPKLTDVRTELPRQLDTIIARATAGARAARYPTMTQLRDELRAVRRLWETEVISQDPVGVVRRLFPAEYEAHRTLLAELPRASPAQLERLLQASIAVRHRPGSASGSGPSSSGPGSSGPGSSGPGSSGPGSSGPGSSGPGSSPGAGRPTDREIIDSGFAESGATAGVPSSSAVTVRRRIDDDSTDSGLDARGAGYKLGGDQPLDERNAPRVELPKLLPEPLALAVATGAPSPGLNASDVTSGTSLFADGLPLGKIVAAVGAVLIIALVVMLWPAKKVPVQLGLIEVATEPAGATVFLDGREERWKTPTVISEVPLGAHELRFVHADTKEARQTVTLTSKEATARVKVVLAQQLVSLQINTTPQRARIVFDGRPIPGESPYTINDLQADRTYRVEVSADGYHPETRTADPANGRLDVELMEIAQPLEDAGP